MYDADMTKIDILLDNAFMGETGVTLSAQDVVRLRRYMQQQKEELRELNIKHLEVLNNSVPNADVADLKKDKEELLLLQQNIASIEYAAKLGNKLVCPNCFHSTHDDDCWIGIASRKARIK